jgi:predicted enzyme related to lactoylglutathione lyase
MPIDQKVDYIELPARNLDSVQSFYETAFCWSFTDFGPEYKAFTDGKIDGGFYKSEHKSTTEKGAVLVVLYARDLEKTKETVISSGGKVVKDIFTFPGGRRFHFTDSNGNELAVWSDQ